MEPAVFVAANAAVAAGSLLQAASGVGAGFVIVPMLAIIEITLVPGPVVFGSLALTGMMVWRERGAIDRAHLPVVLAALAVGAIAGAVALAAVPADRLGLVFGGVLLLAIALSVGGLDLGFTARAAAGCGFLGGAMGASTGAGAAPLALLYQHHRGAAVRATLALLYSTASVFILAALALVGRFGPDEASDGALLMPGSLVGYALANRLRGRLDGRATRPLVLGVSMFAAAVLIARSLVGG